MDAFLFPLTPKEAKSLNISNVSEVNKNALFPKRLRELRHARDLSQADVASSIGVTKSTISLYEQGDSVPDVKTLVKLADFFGVSYNYLLLKSDDPDGASIAIPIIDKREITASSEELQEIVQKFVAALGILATVPVDKRDIFLDIIKQTTTLLDMSLTISVDDILMGHQTALLWFHQAASKLIEDCSAVSEKAIQKYAELAPDPLHKVRISSKNI